MDMINKIDASSFAAGIVAGVVIGNGSFTSFVVGALGGWISANPRENASWIVEKYTEIIAAVK